MSERTDQGTSIKPIKIDFSKRLVTLKTFANFLIKWENF
jgi:hypothetical protein